MKNRELIEKILDMIEEISNESIKGISLEGQKIYVTLCKMLAIKVIEKLGKEDLSDNSNTED